MGIVEGGFKKILAGAAAHTLSHTGQTVFAAKGLQQEGSYLLNWRHYN